MVSARFGQNDTEPCVHEPHRFDQIIDWDYREFGRDEHAGNQERIDDLLAAELVSAEHIATCRGREKNDDNRSDSDNNTVKEVLFKICFIPRPD